MLRLAFALLVLAALSAPGVFLATASDAAPPSATSEEVPYSTLQFGDDLLPAATGWFAVPVFVDRPAYVRVDVESYVEEGPAFSMGQVLVAVEGRGPSPAMGTTSGSAPSVAEASAAGRLAECCSPLLHSMGWSQGDMGRAILLHPGETLWVGLAAYEWHEWSDAWFQVSAQAILAQGEPQTGERVEAVDLYAEARRAGTQARVLNQEVTVATGAAERSWTAEGYGLLAFSAWRSQDDVDARVMLELPGASVERHIGEEGVDAFAHHVGAFKVRLDELTGPTLAQGPWLEAKVLFADVSIPGDAVFIYP
jgi:hypothetical protein